MIVVGTPREIVSMVAIAALYITATAPLRNHTAAVMTLH
jgi:hypothetical protein